MLLGEFIDHCRDYFQRSPTRLADAAVLGYGIGEAIILYVK
jgi:hypothetical protein